MSSNFGDLPARLVPVYIKLYIKVDVHKLR